MTSRDTASPAEPSEAVIKEVGRSSVVLAVRRVLVLVSTGTTTLLLARVLDPQEFGRLQSALATWTIFIVLCDGGFGTVATRLFASDASARRRVMSTVNRVQSVLALLLGAVLVLWALAEGLSEQRARLLLVLAPSIACNGLSAGRAWFMARYDLRTLVAVDCGTALAQLAGVVLVVLLLPSPVAVAAVISIGMACNSLLIGLFARRSATEPGRTIDVKSLVRDVAPLSAMSVLSQIYISIDLVLLGYLTGDAATGHYAGAVKVVSLLNTLPGLVVGASLAGLSRLAAVPQDQSRLLERLLSWLLILVAPVYAVVVLVPAAPVLVILGDQFSPAEPLLRVLAMAGVVGLLSQALGTVLVSRGVVKPLLWVNSGAVVFNVSANVLLVPVLGVVASAYVTLATESLLVLGALVILRRTPVVALSRRPLLLLLALTSTTALAALLPMPGALRVVVYLSAYGVALRLLGVRPAQLLSVVRSESVTPA